MDNNRISFYRMLSSERAPPTKHFAWESEHDRYGRRGQLRTLRHSVSSFDPIVLNRVSRSALPSGLEMSHRSQSDRKLKRATSRLQKYTDCVYNCARRCLSYCHMKGCHTVSWFHHLACVVGQDMQLKRSRELTPRDVSSTSMCMLCPSTFAAYRGTFMSSKAR